MIGTVVLCPRCEVGHFTPPTSKSSSLAEVGGAMSPEERSEQLRRFPYPALSRVASVYICSPCGVDEAMRDFAQSGPVPPDEWPVIVGA